MEIKKMRKIAKEIVNDGMKIGYRNVIGYFVGSDGDGMVFVSKESSEAPIKGTFFDDFSSKKMYNIQTGEEVINQKDVFGKNFFDDDPTLAIDNFTPEGMSLEDKIDILFDATAQLACDLLESCAAFVMAHDFFEEEEENIKYTYQRFVILYNYLKQRTQRIGVEEFAYMHHELMTI